MSRQSPRDCPFCGRMSAAEPAEKLQPHSHRIETVVNALESKNRILAVFCWYCGARGPLSGSVRQAIERWQHVADRQGAPKW